MRKTKEGLSPLVLARIMHRFSTAATNSSGVLHLCCARSAVAQRTKVGAFVGGRGFVTRTYAQSGLRPLFFLRMLKLVLQSAQRFDDLIEPRFEAEESGSGHHAQEKNENEQQE